VGRNNERRRILRWRQKLLPFRKRRKGPHRFFRNNTRSPGPRGRENTVHRRRRKRQIHNFQLSLRHNAGQRRVFRSRSGRFSYGCRHGFRQAGAVQRQRRHQSDGKIHTRKRSREYSALRHDHNEQFAGRTAGIDGKPAGNADAVFQIRHTHVSGLRPFRRKRLLHKDARKRLRKDPGEGNSQSHVRPSRRSLDELEKGRACKHRRIPRDERQESRGESETVSYTYRRFRDVRRTRRQGPGGTGHRTSGSPQRGLS